MEVVAYPEVKKKVIELGDAAPDEVKAWLLQMETAFNQFCTTPEKSEFLRLKFWGKRISNNEICNLMGVKKHRLITWKNELLTLVGKNVGMIE
ncbi:hypothetical protein P6N53_16150 [Desulforamulus aquiferis]|uniref:Uncharacterized protein n=2 Tax=Desulforamulus aquiferis TaxID=1397668 RepID=A0AAW7ZH51_9FIRM|nr:hypothetical protein [Desulforamulus aquiferis]